MNETLCVRKMEKLNKNIFYADSPSFNMFIQKQQEP
jgi:hypothetical protein